MSERRRFLQKARGAMVGVAAATIVDAHNIIAQPKIRWRMSTAFAASVDMHHSAAQRLGRSSTR